MSVSPRGRSTGAVEVDGQRRGPLVGVGLDRRDGGWFGADVLDAADRPAVEVDVEEVAARADLEVDGARGRRLRTSAGLAGRDRRSRPASITQMQSRE